MKPRIGLVANDIHHGLCYQRAHIFMKELRGKYDFTLLNQEGIEKCEPFYLDAMIIFHPYNSKNELLIHRSKIQYGIPVIVDVDDYISNLTTDHPGYASFKNNKVVSSITFAEHLVVSTDYLAKVYGDLNKNITVIENAIDPRRYKGIDHGVKPYHAGFTVGWTGGQTHQSDLYNTGFIEGLSMAMRENDNIRAYFHILCPQILLDEFGSRVIYSADPVDFLDYPSLCFTFPFDVCAVPLHDAPFNDAKSDLRLLDMAPFKIPVVASPRHEFRRHRDKGLLHLVEKDHPEAWRDAILDLSRDPQKVKDLGQNSYDYVMRERLASQGAEKWDHVLRRVLELG